MFNLSTIDARVKVITLLLTVITLFCIHTYVQLALLALLAGMCMYAAHAAQNELALFIKPFIYVAVVLFVINAFTIQEGTILFTIGPFTVYNTALLYSGFSALRLILLVLFGASVLVSTSQTQLTQAFESLLSPLTKFGIPVSDIALILALALRFIPTITKEAQAIYQAQLSRGAAVLKPYGKERIMLMTTNIVPLFASAIRHAEALSLALDARGWNMFETHTSLHPLCIQCKDIAFTLSYLLYLVICVCIGFI